MRHMRHVPVTHVNDFNYLPFPGDTSEYAKMRHNASCVMTTPTGHGRFDGGTE